MTAPHLYIIRGVPGSGKSTFAQTLLAIGLVRYRYEADMWMHDDNGEYKFDPIRHKAAHLACQAAVAEGLHAGHSVAVANTFTRIWELETYTSMGFPFTVIRLENNFPNIHNVPKAVVDNMRERFEDFPHIAALGLK